jgi:hypothetical protein
MKIPCYKISRDDFVKIFGRNQYWNDNEDIRCAPVADMTERELKKLSEVLCFDFWEIKDYKYIIAEQ